MLEQRSLNLGRTDSEINTLDYIIRPPHEPEISIRITRSPIPRQIPSIAESILGHLRIVPILRERSNRPLGRNTNRDLSFLAIRHRLLVLIHDVEVIPRHHTAHRTR